MSKYKTSDKYLDYTRKSGMEGITQEILQFIHALVLMAVRPRRLQWDKYID
jgi:hypothetical protein